jgi:hypothetical protein
MHSRTLDFQLVIFSGLIISLVIGFGLILSGLSSMSALAEPVPFNCMILPGQEVASILMTNSLASDASCIVTCKFQTTKYDNNPQITCAKPVPAGKEVEMCLLSAGGDKLLKLTEGHAECAK